MKPLLLSLLIIGLAHCGAIRGFSDDSSADGSDAQLINDAADAAQPDAVDVQDVQVVDTAVDSQSETSSDARLDTCTSECCVTAQRDWCNGIDDNCDGRVDENTQMISCGVGACSRTVSDCVNGVLQSCEPLRPTTETCNGIDDDCNGVVDNGFDLQSDNNNCGACDRACPAHQRCEVGQCGGCRMTNGGLEICDGIDNDCNGRIDDNINMREVCNNNVDDDCDGMTDEQPCS